VWTYHGEQEYFSKSNQSGTFVLEKESSMAEIAWVPPPGTYKTVDGRTEYVCEWPFSSDCLTSHRGRPYTNKAKGTLTMGKESN
jgi:hypothetical protein